jgi:hypothetical protein
MMMQIANRLGSFFAPLTQQSGVATPLETYRIPDWLAGKMFSVPTQLGGKGDGVAQANPDAAAMTPAQRDAYAGFVQDQYHAVLAANGIGTAEEHYRATIADPARSAVLKGQFLERMKAYGNVTPDVKALLDAGAPDA